MRGGIGRRQDDVGIALGECADRRDALVEELQIFLVDIALADAIEDVEQRLVALPEYLCQLEQMRADALRAARRR